MRTLAIFLFSFLTFSLSFSQERKITGKITVGEKPLSEVIIKNLDTGLSSITDKNGKYTIIANKGEVLEYTETAMKTVIIRVEDVTRVLNLAMQYNATQLDEVVLVEDLKKRSPEKYLESQYLKNDKIIYTRYGYMDASVSPVNIQVISGKRLGLSGTCFLSLLESRFPNLIVQGDCARGAIVTTRRGIGFGNSNGFVSDAIGDNPNGVIFDVDGQIFREAPTWLFSTDIERIAFINGRSNASFYSVLGASAVIIINTIHSIPIGLNKGNVVLKDSKMIFSVLDKEQVRTNWPNYLKELHASSSYEQAKKVYDKLKDRHSGSAFFFLDAYRYFHDNWNEKEYADTIINDNIFRFQDNPVHLKALAYIYDGQNRFKMSNRIYKEVFILRPNYTQSYYDMANSYLNTNEPEKAISIYARYDYLLTEGFMQADVLGFSPIIKRDYENLIFLNDIDNAMVDDIENNLRGKTRVTFEWSDSEAEFEISFINAKKHFSKFTHNIADNADKVLRSKDYGYSIFERFLESSTTDDWTIYATYLGNKSLTPSYLKVTLFHNYGEKNQRREVQTFKLFIKNKTKELIRVKNNETLVMQ
ncbi:tetratricopeptide repeat protein [Flagellimonas eckloniae]|uniref:Uncharacterized protein n=1 Tax=Flagellimonas eckloniae TaxID=346185 RepID=A0A0Q0XK52_9FLAO|nr:hypothetical protein [Allomuricauda eckloniae]KQC29266.1 hypothetical protein AAY42_04615 [Allomuricauda eckloniae]